MTTAFRGATLRPLPDLAAKGHEDAPMEEVGDPCSLPKAWLSSADKRLKAEVACSDTVEDGGRSKKMRKMRMTGQLTGPHGKTKKPGEIRGIVTFDMVKAGLHCSLRMSRQMLPLLLTFG
ncbi:hypothetical protein BHE74_00004465 [Ensete ventricosum]|nr:hypothetical protein BHE74_00004465 [Ensete ventricosum]